MHLCGNILFGHVIPNGEQVRRSFSFRRGEKSFLNRRYRAFVDKILSGKYQVTDYFFSLGLSIHMNSLNRVIDLAKSATVELMTHPARAEEYAFLIGDSFRQLKEQAPAGAFEMVKSARVRVEPGFTRPPHRNLSTHSQT